MEHHQKHEMHDRETEDLPIVPDKLYFTIGEVAKLCKVKPHVLRYWEQEFDALNPSKRRGNRRYYQRNDIMTVRKIKGLLYKDGFTIEGARMQIQKPSNSMPLKSEIVLQALESLERVLDELNK